jgi:hypothetical protein
MNKKEVYEVLETIQQFHDRFEITQKRIDAWYEVLKDYDIKPILNKVIRIASTSKFVPSIAELIEGQYRELRNYDITENVYSPEIMAALEKENKELEMKWKENGDESLFKPGFRTSSNWNKYKEK